MRHKYNKFIYILDEFKSTVNLFLSLNNSDQIVFGIMDSVNSVTELNLQVPVETAVEGPYEEEEPDEDDGAERVLLCTLTNIEKIERRKKNYAQGQWISDLKLVELTVLKGNIWKFMGFSRDKKNYFYPEEAMFLVQQDKLEVCCGDRRVELAELYALVVDSISFPCFLTYSKLMVRVA